MDQMEKKLADLLSRFKGTRGELIPILQETQAAFGYLPKESIKIISRFLKVPASQIYGVATFFAQFYFTPRGKHTVKVCMGTACHVKGGARLLEAFERELGVGCGCTTENHEFSLERVNCVGSCAIAPVVMVDEEVYGHLENKRVKEVLDRYVQGS
ncbi:MAG: NADH-quinone oxidoreductase subunit NuoE [Bacillota bacterium]